MHGGSTGSGAPVGSQNALKHGLTTQDVKDTRNMVREHLNKFKILTNIK